MAISTSCFLNLSDFASGSKPSLPAPLLGNESWSRSKIVLGVTCIVLGLGTGNLVCNENVAIAEGLELVAQSNKRSEKWSDKRACPPWSTNSWEIIVPENLPRHSFHRGWNPVINPTKSRNVVVTSKTHPKCFTL